MALKGLRERQQSAAPPADPENEAWNADAAPNTAALSSKQRYELKRVRAYYDVPQEVKDGVEKVAEKVGTSASQVAGFLLAQALDRYLADDGQLWAQVSDAKRPARTLRFEWTLALPRKWIEGLRAFLRDGAD